RTPPPVSSRRCYDVGNGGAYGTITIVTRGRDDPLADPRYLPRPVRPPGAHAPVLSPRILWLLHARVLVPRTHRHWAPVGTRVVSPLGAPVGTTGPVVVHGSREGGRGDMAARA